MRRKEKEITNIKDIESIIRKSLVCRLAMMDEHEPYIVPLSFGYRDNTLYFHSAKKGKKLDVLKKNNQVCCEFDIDVKIEKADKACKWGIEYKSVIGFGKASFIKDLESKRKALDIIMKHYSDKSFTYSETDLKKVAIIKVELQNVTGKQSI